MATKVSKSDLPELLLWVQNLLPDSFKLYQELQSHLSGKFPDLDFYVDRWPDPGAAAAVVDPSGEQLKCREGYKTFIMGVAGTTDEALTVVLKDKRVVDWSKTSYFPMLAEKHCTVIETLTEEMGGRIGQRWPLYLLKATAQHLLSISLPEGMKVSPISEENVSIVDSTWKYHSDLTGDYIRDQIQFFPSVALQTDSGEHVGHMIGQSFGTMGLLHVLPPFRRKGYAKVIISQLAQKYFESEKGAYVFIETDNQPSLNLHTSVGFRIVPDIKLEWMAYYPKDC